MLRVGWGDVDGFGGRVSRSGREGREFGKLLDTKCSLMLLEQEIKCSRFWPIMQVFRQFLSGNEVLLGGYCS